VGIYFKFHSCDLGSFKRKEGLWVEQGGKEREERHRRTITEPVLSTTEGPVIDCEMNQVRALFTRMSQQGGGGVPQGSGTGVSFLILTGLGAYGAYNSLVTVQPGHKGVVYNRFGGLDDKHRLNEGLNFVIPWFQRPIIFDVRTRPQPIDTTSGSKDLQMVTISLRVLFKPDPNQLGFIYRRLGKGKKYIYIYII
jgi:hypothetical protein